MVKILANAKVNLFLQYTGREPNGYFTIESLVAFAELCNEIEIEKSDNMKVEFSGVSSDLIDPADNTITKAIQLLSDYSGKSEQFSIKVKKYIPTGAGMGSGSADAGAVMRFLCEQWGIEDNKVHDLAFKVGADTVVCFKNRMCLVSGSGDKLTEISGDLRAIPILIVNSGKFVSTIEVYKVYRELQLPFSQAYSSPKIAADNVLQVMQSTKNDLYEASIKIAPEIEEVVNALKVLKGCVVAQMLGSGDTCMGVFNTMKEAKAAQKVIKGYNSDWWTEVSNIIQ